MPAVNVAWEGGAGRPAVFMHANGFPPLAYRLFLEALAERAEVKALATRPLLSAEPPDRSLRWSDLGDDLVRWLEAEKSPPVLAIGHSMGATSLMYAAAAHPERFSGLVIIEPAMLGPLTARILHALPMSLRRRIQPAKAALGKRDRWPDEAAFRRSCDRSGLYRRLTPEGLDALVAAAVRSTDSGVSLVFPKEWEAYGYMTAPFPGRALASVTVPVIGVRGEPSVFLDDRRWRVCVAAQPSGWFTQLGGVGHLLPLEAPARAAAAIFEGLDALGR
jgi:pimeloyl-ACP methyl ester carboxylesterase